MKQRTEVLEEAIAAYLRDVPAPVGYLVICQNIEGTGDEIENAILNLMASGKVKCISFMHNGRLMQNFALIDKHNTKVAGFRECRVCHTPIHGEQRTIYCKDECAKKVLKLRAFMKQWKTPTTLASL